MGCPRPPIRTHSCYPPSPCVLASAKSARSVMPRTGRRSGGKTPDHITKARLVEEIAALLHEQEGVTVERNVRLASLSDPTNIREIDVLVTGNVAGYPVRIPIEC